MCESPTSSSFLFVLCGTTSCDSPSSFSWILQLALIHFLHCVCIKAPWCRSSPSSHHCPDPHSSPGSQLPVLSRYSILAERDTLKFLDQDRDPLLQESKAEPYCCRMHIQHKEMTKHFTGYSEADSPRAWHTVVCAYVWAVVGGIQTLIPV